MFQSIVKLFILEDILTKFFMNVLIRRSSVAKIYFASVCYNKNFEASTYEKKKKKKELTGKF